MQLFVPQRPSMFERAVSIFSTNENTYQLPLLLTALLPIV